MDREVYAEDGLPVFLIAHGSHKHPEKDVWYCYECGEELAKYLKDVLHIGKKLAVLSSYQMSRLDKLFYCSDDCKYFS